MQAKWIPRLLPPLERLAERDWLADLEAIRALCLSASRRVWAGGSADLSSRLLVEGVARVLRALAIVTDALAVVTRPGGETHARVRSRLYVADHLPALLNALRIVLALVSVELIWIVTSWPHGPVMITFTAVNVILAGRQPDAAFSWAVEFAIGCVVAGLIAVILDLAILPRIHGGPLALSLVLTAVLLPVGVLAAGAWHKALFVTAVANIMPILALENEPSYEATRIFETALAVGAGVVMAAIWIRLLPPLVPRRRIERLLQSTLRDLRNLVGGRREFTQDTWLGLVSSRLAAMPKEASLEQEAELLATLSVGEAAIALLAAAYDYPDRDLLEHAFTSLAASRIDEARESFARFSARQSLPPPGDAERGIDVAVPATLIADALQRHERFFARKA